MFKNKEWEAPVGSINVSELDDDEKAALGIAVETAEAEDLSSLYKSELVDRAQAAGIDTAGLSKAELVEALEAGDG